MASIRIKSVPPGEAPLAIRAAWVGLELPLFRDTPRTFLTSGVLSGPRSSIQRLVHLLTFRLRVESGFVVPSCSAIEILEQRDPESARWWRENAPHAMRPRHNFLFAVECCERAS